MLPMGFGRINVVSLRAELVSTSPVSLRGEHVMLRLAVGEVCCPEIERSNGALI